MSEMDYEEDYQDDEDYDVSGAEDDEDEDMEYGEDDSDEYEDDNSSFAPVIADKDRLKAYEVEFIVHSMDDILKFQHKEVSHVSALIGCPPEHAATLLRHFRWNKERLVEQYMEKPEAVAHESGVILDSSKQPKFVAVPGFMCDICCNDEAGLLTLAMSCNHRFCRDCYEHYLTQKIAEEGESRRIQCPASGCKVVVDEKTVEMVVKEEVCTKYKNLLLRTYVDDNPTLRWCPAPNCEYAVECHVPSSQFNEKVPTVICRCGHKFCFGCSLPDHIPCICALVRIWLKKCEDDSETANWISANTKECTKCNSTIEKNGGCNHMTCRKCKYEFCWVCQGPWIDHGTAWYNCNRFDEKNSVDARDSQAKSRAALERYLHYYNRYANHEQSAKLDKDLYEKTEKKMEQMQTESKLSWIEVQFLKKSAETLLEARQILKWTYAFAYYLHRDNMTAIFEDNQRDLEMRVEELSGLMEQPLDLAKEEGGKEGEGGSGKDKEGAKVVDKVGEFRQKVLDVGGYVVKRREVLLTDTAKGFEEGRWKYNVMARASGVPVVEEASH